MVARILAGLVALLMGLSALNWLIDPAGAAEGLGMPFLEGAARSTQVGDFSAFFFGVTIFCIMGAVKQQTTWLYSAAIILGLAAAMRTLAWAVHGAAFVSSAVAVEVVLTVLLLISARFMSKAGADSENTD